MWFYEYHINIQYEQKLIRTSLEYAWFQTLHHARVPRRGLTRSNYFCPDCRKELKTKHKQPPLLQQNDGTRTPTPPVGYCADNIRDSVGDDAYSPESEKTSDCTSEEESNCNFVLRIHLKVKKHAIALLKKNLTAFLFFNFEGT